MLEPIVDFFERLISDFSWRRLLFILAFVGTVVGGLIAFETYTRTFELARMEKELSLLERLADLSEAPSVHEKGELESVYTKLAENLEREVSRNEDIGIVPVWLKKAIAALVPWFALAFFIAVTQWAQGKRFDSKTGLGMAFVATPFVVLGMFLPTFSAAWVNYILYPVAHTAIVVLAILAWYKRKEHAA